MNLTPWILVLLTALPASAEIHDWSQHFGDEASSASPALCADDDGNVVVGGRIYGAADFGGGLLPTGAYVAKFDADGTHLWSGTYGGEELVVVKAVDADGAGNTYAVGSLRGSVDFGGGLLTAAGASAAFLVKFDSAGNYLWSRAFGDNFIAWDVAAHEDGRVVVVGDGEGTIDFGAGPRTTLGEDIFVASFAADGTHLFGHVFGDESDQGANAVAFDPGGNVVVGGSLFGTADFGGGAGLRRGRNLARRLPRQIRCHRQPRLERALRR